MLRVRLQSTLVRKGGTFLDHLNGLRLEGYKAWRKGLVASLLRECTYSSTRISIYPSFKLILGDLFNAGDSSLFILLASGACAGASGAIVGNPADLIKTRQMNCTGKPQSLLALGRAVVHQEGGVLSLWKGLLPSAQRAAVITAAQLGSYDYAKLSLRKRLGVEEGPVLQVLASATAGFAATLASSPFDNVKTTVYNMSCASPSTASVLASLVREGGLSQLFRGFLPSYARLGVHTFVTLNCLEYLRREFGFSPI